MEALVVPASIRRKLGDEAAEGLVEMFGLYHQLTSERFERRLAEEVSGLRLEMHQGFAAIRREMSLGHVAWLRWSFLFWIGQVAALAALLAIMLPANR
ncbi:MAG: hypothetical protein HYX77_06105 [Acidobacteria bacterium]|nr:hypothetical protein [Acidobacteriota bacterium]